MVKSMESSANSNTIVTYTLSVKSNADRSIYWEEFLANHIRAKLATPDQGMDMA
jgi:hypothetical protein